MASAATAHVAHHLIQYMHRQIYGDKDVPTTAPKNFLPFPDLKYPEEDDKNSNTLKSSTRTILNKLAATGRIPLKIKEAFTDMPPELGRS